MVRTPGVTRGWACIARLAAGPRFVRARCEGFEHRALPAPAPRALPRPMREKLAVREEITVLPVRATPEEMRFLARHAGETIVLPAPKPQKPKKARGPKRKVDWDKCKCPKGSELEASKRGQVCVKKTPKGGRRFVAAECP